MTALFTLGLAAILLAVLAILWSIFVPTKRVWPLECLTTTKFILIWGVTFITYGTMIAISFWNWNGLNIPPIFRYFVGLPLLLIGHIIVWLGVKNLGLKATSGAPGALRIQGIYKYSRNPQYMADIISLAGWAILCASLWALPLITGIAITFYLTPFAEEMFLRETHGKTYDEYCKTTPRFLNFPIRLRSKF